MIVPDPNRNSNMLVGTRGRSLRPETVDARGLRAEGKKRCPQCRVVKPLDKEHFVWRSARGGHFKECRECDRSRTAAHHAANPEIRRAQATRWACENPERKREIARKARQTRRARIAEVFVEEVDPQVLYERDEGVCGVCGKPVDRDEFDVDHVVQVAHGGEHSYANTRIAHVSCNRRRNRRRDNSLVEVEN